MFLPDVNLWLALAFESHFHHQAAKNWFDPDLGRDLLVLPHDSARIPPTGHEPEGVRRGSSLAIPGVGRMYDALLADPRIAFASEPAGIEPLWRGYTARESFSPKLWNDAFLAAFARASSLELVTFDNGFRQFEGLNCTILA